MSLEHKIKEGVRQFLKSENLTFEESSIALQPTKKEFEGDYTFVVFPFVKQARMAPAQLAEKIGAFLLPNSGVVENYNVVQGFLNLKVSNAEWFNSLQQIVNEASYGRNQEKKEKVMVEYSSPNTNKPLHLGHLRNNFLGYAVSTILTEAGHEVVMANLINDRGIHICKSMLAYQKFGSSETPSSSGKKGDHLVGDYYVKFDQEYKKEIEELVKSGKSEEDAKKEAPLMVEAQQMLKKWEEGDEEVVVLWKKMNNWVYDGFNETYQRINVRFDQYYYESETYLLGKDIVEEGLEMSVFYKKGDDSVWCNLDKEGLDEKLVLRGDGTAVYITQDMGTADLKYREHKIEKSVYVVGNEQDYHFNVLKKILSKLQKPYAEGIYHMSYGMVDLPTGKMKSREGTVVDADDLIDEMVNTAKRRTMELGKIDGFTEEEAEKLYHQLALGALKYYILKVDPKKRMLFNPEESIDFQGNTGPFIQYTHARISAILRKADQDNIDYRTLSNNKVDMHELESQVIVVLNDFPKKINEAAEHYAPSIIANYVYDLAKAYNRFYQELPILKGVSQEMMQYRIALCYAVAKVIKKSLNVLGIEAPERM